MAGRFIEPNTNLRLYYILCSTLKESLEYATPATSVSENGNFSRGQCTFGISRYYLTVSECYKFLVVVPGVSGNPFHGVLLALYGEMYGVRPLSPSSPILKAGDQLLIAGAGLNALAGVPSNALIRLRWLRRFVFGDTDGGGLAGRLKTTAGVRG